MCVRVRLLSVFSFCAALLFAASTAFAQGQITTTTNVSTSDDDHGGIGVGIKAGPLFSSLNSDVVNSPLDTRTGWIGGIFLGGNRHGVVGAGVDIHYARKKVGTPSGDETLDYLNVPVYLRLNGGSSSLGGVNVFGIVGPDFNFRLKGKLNFNDGLDDQMESADVGLAVGAGIEITRFIVEGRYTKGFRNIKKDLTTGDKITTTSFSVMFGVRLN
jgi:hypothetical protein